MAVFMGISHLDIQHPIRDAAAFTKVQSLHAVISAAKRC
jgi:hypothetical protein